MRGEQIVEQPVIQTISGSLQLTFWSFDRSSNLFSLLGPFSPESKWVGMTEDLLTHPYILAISGRFHNEIFHIMHKSLMTDSVDVFFEFQIKIEEQKSWFLLVGKSCPATNTLSGMITPYQKKKIEDLEKEALSKAVNGLILRGEKHKKKESQKYLSEKLSHQEAELLAQKLQANQNENRIDQIIKSLKSRNIDRVSLLRRLKQRNNTEINWNEFKAYFSQVDPKFVPLLWDKYPNLTDREIKICVLIRLGLSTKDIAHLTRLAPKSIEVYRYNIRKKMKLERAVSLMNALSLNTW